jgi:DNA modification methylase
MFSFVGDTVLDPFGGSGTTAVAAMRSGRNSVSYEIEPAYVALARERLAVESAGLPGTMAARSGPVTATVPQVGSCGDVDVERDETFPAAA